MSETLSRAFRREPIAQLSKSLISNYICTKVEGGKLGFKLLKFLDKDGDEDTIKIKDIFEKDFTHIQNLFSILDDLVAYDLCRSGVDGQLAGFWNRFKEENFSLPKNDEADAGSPTDMIKLNLSQCDQAIRLIYGILGAEDYIREKEKLSEKKGEKKYTFGSLLFDDEIDKHINDCLGRFKKANKSVMTVFSVLLANRNKWAIHPKTAVDSESKQNQNIVDLLEDCRNKTAIVLVALLHIVDYHYEALDAFFVDFFNQEENKKRLSDEAAKEGTTFDPEVIKGDYAHSLFDASNVELKKNVGMVGNIVNEENLRLMNLKMQLDWKDQAPVAVNPSTDEEDDDLAQDVTYLDLQHITDAENRVNIILGNPGSGKSTLLAQLQKTLVSRWIDGEIGALYPISMALKGVGKNNFVDAIRDSVGERLFSVVEPMCKAGEVVFILDGLNELPLKNPQNFLDSLCKAIRSEYACCRFYITGRKHEFEGISARFHLLKECSIYLMRDISRDDIDAYFKELRAAEESKNTFLEWVQNAQLSDLLASPLNFSMIAKMVLNQKDYTVPVESINNRGELLDLFLKSTLKDEGVLTTGIDGESFRLLQLLAVALDDNNNLPVSAMALSAYCEELYPDMSSFDRELIIMNSLADPCSLNVLSKSVDVNGMELYSFTIDTFQEFFHARNIAVSFVGNAGQGISGKALSECLSEGFRVQDARRFEMLKLALELIAGGRIQMETADQDGLRFVEDVLDNYSGSLGILADLSSSLALSAEARTFVEKGVLERMVSYRELNVMPSPEEDKAELLSLTKSAVKLSTDSLYKELFNYYWMSATGMAASWEFGFKYSFPTASIIQFRTNLVSNCTDPIKFYDYLHQAALDILPLYPASTGFLNLTKNLLFSELTTYRQKILYLHIRECYDRSVASGLYSRPDHLLSQDSSLLLMCIDDPVYISEHLDLEEMKRSGTRIGMHPLMKLLRNFRHHLIPRIIFQKDFFSLLKAEGKTKEDRETQKKFRISSIIRFYLFRNCLPQELLDYLSPAKGNGLEYLLPQERLPLLDLLPISELRAYKQRYYDADVFQYLDENDDEEESSEGLHYRIHHRTDNQTYVCIRNISTPLKGLTAVIGSNKAEIANDEVLISRQYRFKISSSAIIEATGTMLVSGRSINYDAPFAGPEIIVPIYDDEVAGLLADAGTVQIGESQICSITKTFESQPKSWRVLTLAGMVGIPYFGDMQFARNGEAVSIDKTIRREGYRFDPRLFRRLERLPYLNCPDAPFVLLGQSSTKVWVVTDKLMNYDRYMNAGAIVRAKGHDVPCRFLEAHPFSDGFVELTFRSAIPFKFPEEGMLYYSTDNKEEESVPYAFCHSVGTRAVVRILDQDFLQSISIYENRLSYMAGYFHIGRLSLILDYVEIFPASERLSIWTLQRLTNQPFPHDGALEVGEDSGFERKFQLTFTSETRRTQSGFEICRCLHCDAEKNVALFVVDNPAEPIATGLYLTHDSHASHLRIVESRTCHWIAEASFTPEIQIPQSGHFDLPGCNRPVSYYIVSNKSSLITAVLYSFKDEIDFAAFEPIWNSAQSFDIASDDEKVVRTGFRGEKALSIMEGNQLLFTDVPSGFAPSENDEKDWYLSVFCPVRNEMERGYDTVENTIKVHSVPYTRFSEKAIIIRKPVTEFGHLYVQCDNQVRFASIISVSKVDNESFGANPFGIEYCVVELRGEGGKQLYINPNGEISFFSKQSGGYLPVSVGYRRVLEVIDLKKNRDLRRVQDATGLEKGYHYYPSQICERLIKELSDIKVINEDLVRFFADHSRAYMLFSEDKLLSIVQSINCEEPLINLCTVQAIENDGQVRTFSWLTNAPFPSMDQVDGRVHVGDLVFVERNHKITPASPDMIKGSVFPTIGELPAFDDGVRDHVISPNTWQEEEDHVRKFKAVVTSLVSFLSQDEVAAPLSVVLPGPEMESDKSGIIVQCPKLPDVAFRLCSVCESSYEALMSGKAIQVLPSMLSKQSFNPYKYTPRGIVFVLDAADRNPKRNANYYCVVNDHAVKHSRKENLVGVVFGDHFGSFVKDAEAQYKNGDIVHLQLSGISKSERGNWYLFTTSLNTGVRLDQLNLHVGDVLEDLEVTNNGPNNAYIEVDYKVQGGVIKGSVDNSDIPAFSSRMLCGFYGLGTHLSLRVKELKYDSNSIQFELVDKTVVYPFKAGVYDCHVHLDHRAAFEWRVNVKDLWGWATFRAEGIDYTVAIPYEERLKASAWENGSNLYTNYLSCGQRIPAQLEITGFSEWGDPIIKLQTHNLQLLNALPGNAPFEAKIMYVNTQEHVALWMTESMSGLARFRVRPKVGSMVSLHPNDGSGERIFIIDNEAISDEILTEGQELFAIFNWDERYDDDTLFVADEIDSDSRQPTGRRFLCRHSPNILSQYWIEYLIYREEPLRARVELVDGDIHQVTFDVIIENDVEGIKWNKNQEYSVSVKCYTRSYIIVSYLCDDGRTIIGAVDFKWMPDYDAFKPGDALKVKFLWYNNEQKSVVFSPLNQVKGVFPYGLKNGDIVPCKVYRVDNKGFVYVSVCNESGVLARVVPFRADWSVLPSGKPVVQVGDVRSYAVFLKKQVVKLSIADENPWKEISLSCHSTYPVVIVRVDAEDVMVSLDGLYGEIPTREFHMPLEELEDRVGETIQARPALIDLSVHTLLFTTIGVEEPGETETVRKQACVGDVITATVKECVDEVTPLFEWEGQQFQVSPIVASFLARQPWLEQVDVKRCLPPGSKHKLVVSEVDDRGAIIGAKPCNLGSDAFFDGEETSAVVLYCASDGVYAKTTDDPEKECYIFIPKDELLWGRVYTTNGFFPSGELITVVKRNRIVKPILLTCSVKRLFEEPKLVLKADETVDVKIEKILPEALIVLCDGVLHTQISVEDTTWNPAYLLGNQAVLTKRFSVGDTLKAFVEEGGRNQGIRLSLRDRVNPWEFGQLVVGDEWPACIVKILDEDHFVVTCRGYFVRVSNKLNLEIRMHIWVKIQIREVLPDEAYASAVLVDLLPNGGEEVVPVDPERIPFRVGERIPVRITRIHHPLLDGDVEEYLEFTPISFDSMCGYISSADLAWESENRKVDGFRVGDQLDVLITGIDFRKMTLNASLRDTEGDVRDTRSIDKIIADSAVDRVKERILVTIQRLTHHYYEDTGILRYFIDFTYGRYPGRVTMDADIMDAIQDPELFYQPGRKIRVQVVGKTVYKGKTFLKAIIPSMKVDESSWMSIAERVGEIDSARILYILSDEVFVRYAKQFVVKMTRDQLVWEPNLPLIERYRVGQDIPVLVEQVSVGDHLIVLDSKCLKDNPYIATLSIKEGDLCKGKVLAEDKDGYYLDIDVENDNRVSCFLPFSEFPYPWHKSYEKGEKVQVCISRRNLDTCEIFATRKDERLSGSEKEFVIDAYYWFKVFEYQKDGIVFDYEGYRSIMAWEDAWLDNVSDPSDMYPVGLKCLLRVKGIEGSQIYVSAGYDWESGLNNIKPGDVFLGEVCLRNPAKGIVMRVIDTEKDFCFITRRNFSEPLMSDILSYIPRQGHKLIALSPKKDSPGKEVGPEKVFARFYSSTHPFKPKNKDFDDVRPGMVVNGIVKRVVEKYAIVLYKDIQIYVDRDYIDSDVRRDDPLTIRITHHEYYKDNNGSYVSKKLLGSACAVYNDPFRELSIGKQVTGLVVIAKTQRRELFELRVDLPHRGTVIGKLLLPWENPSFYRGQKVTAYVSYHHYETHEVQFTLFRPNPARLAVGSIVKANVLKIDSEANTFTAEVPFQDNRYKLDVPIESLFWGTAPSTSFLKVGSRLSMAVTACDNNQPTALTRRAMYMDYRYLQGEIVRGKVMAHDGGGCVIMAGANLGYMPIDEMSYQHCELWTLMFPVGESFDFMVCEEDEAYGGATIFSYRKVQHNPFEIFNPRTLLGKKTFMGEIVRATRSKAVAKLPSGAEALITNMDVFSDGFQTIIPEEGTNVRLKIVKVELDNDDRWIIEVKVIPFIFVASQR